MHAFFVRFYTMKLHIMQIKDIGGNEKFNAFATDKNEKNAVIFHAI